MYGNGVKRMGMVPSQPMPHNQDHYARATSPYEADRPFGYAPHQYGAIHYGTPHYGAAKQPCLALGASGPPVTKLQNLLKDWLVEAEAAAGYAPEDTGLVTDLDDEAGTFGRHTENIVELFQTEQGFSAKEIDGIVGPQTWGALGLTGASCGGGGSGPRTGETGVLGPPWYLNPWYWGGITVGAITIWWGVSAMSKKGKARRAQRLFSNPITYIMGDYPKKKRKKSRGRRK